jgi:stage III sporulation protein AD
MDTFCKATAAALVVCVLGATLQKQGRDISILLVMAASVMIALAAISYLEDVVAFIGSLARLAQLDSEMLRIILKTTGIGLVGELSSMVAIDSGNSALGKSIQMMTVGVVLWLAIPLLESLLELVTSILGQV